MPSRNSTFTVHPTLGGLDMTSDPSVLDANFLTVADNVEYLEAAQRKKRLGTSIYSTSTGDVVGAAQYLMTSGDSIRAIKDFWRYGTSLTPTQNIVVLTGKSGAITGSIMYSTGNGRWDSVGFSDNFGTSANVQGKITLAGDYAVFSDETMSPTAWDQGGSVVTPSTGSAWPKFTGSSYHLNRLFIYGLSTAPSRLQYMAANNIFDSTGGDTGQFTVNVGDGDQIMGVSAPFYGKLYVFKGPKFGSIWEFGGKTAASFDLSMVGHGAPLLNHRAVVNTPTDVYWLSQYGVHSLQTTIKYGNVESAFLSLPIQTLWRDGILDRDEFPKVWGFWHPSRNIVGWAVTPKGSSPNKAQNWLLCYNTALSDPAPGGRKYWSIQKFGFGLTCGDTVLLPPTWNALRGWSRSGLPTMFFGTNRGSVYAWDSTSFGDAGVAYKASVRTPTLTRFPTAQGTIGETQEKVFAGITTYFVPKGNTTATIGHVIDRDGASTTIPMTGIGDVLT